MRWLDWFFALWHGRQCDALSANIGSRRFPIRLYCQRPYGHFGSHRDVDGTEFN